MFRCKNRNFNVNTASSQEIYFGMLITGQSGFESDIYCCFKSMWNKKIRKSSSQWVRETWTFRFYRLIYWIADFLDFTVELFSRICCRCYSGSNSRGSRGLHKTIIWSLNLAFPIKNLSAILSVEKNSVQIFLKVILFCCD